MTKVINDYIGSSWQSIKLDYTIMIHIVPSWTSDTSHYAKQIAKTNIDALYELGVNDIYPELNKVSMQDKQYATTRYNVELESLNNFIAYYSDRQIPTDKSFQELFETFIVDTSDEAIVNGHDICMFEEHGTIYLLPKQRAIDMIRTNNINPYTGTYLNTDTIEKLTKHYRVEMQMLN